MNLQEKFRNLKTRGESVKTLRIRGEERMAAAKVRLTKAVEASKAKGYPDPRVLEEVSKAKTSELATVLENLDTALTEQEKVLRAIGE
jgi:hypothetical protein